MGYFNSWLFLEFFLLQHFLSKGFELNKHRYSKKKYSYFQIFINCVFHNDKSIEEKD